MGPSLNYNSGKKEKFTVNILSKNKEQSHADLVIIVDGFREENLLNSIPESLKSNDQAIVNCHTAETSETLLDRYLSIQKAVKSKLNETNDLKCQPDVKVSIIGYSMGCTISCFLVLWLLTRYNFRIISLILIAPDPKLLPSEESEDPYFEVEELKRRFPFKEGGTLECFISAMRGSECSGLFYCENDNIVEYDENVEVLIAKTKFESCYQHKMNIKETPIHSEVVKSVFKNLNTEGGTSLAKLIRQFE